MPTLAWPTPCSAAINTPLKPVSTLEAMKAPMVKRLTEMPFRRAAAGLPPTAYMQRPSGVCSVMSHSTTATIST
jgi:hypothetical protein